MLPYNQIAPFRTYISLDSPLTDLLNVKYVITEHEVPLPKYRQVYQDEAVRVYENLGVAPRASRYRLRQPWRSPTARLLARPS